MHQDLVKTLTTASPLNAPFHEALDSADLDTLKAALEAKGLKAAARKAIQARIGALETLAAQAAPPEPGTKYKPANQREGDAFMRRFCDECALLESEGNGCSILDATFHHKVTDPEYPAEWTYDTQGKPVCTAIKLIGTPVEPAKPAIHPPTLAAMHRDGGIEKYRPSNGTEGEIFHAAWCAKCAKLDPDKGCWIAGSTMCYDIDDPEYPNEWRYGEDGQPECTAFQAQEAAQDAQETEAPPWDSQETGQGQEAPQSPDFAGMAMAGTETQEPPKPDPAIDPEFLVKTALSTIKRNIGVLTGHGWTEGDVIAALADMLPGRSKAGLESELSGVSEDERFPASILLGELIAAATKQLRLCMVPWNTMPEDKQKDVLGWVRQDCEKAAKNALRTFAAESRTNFVASLDNVQFKPNGVVAKITIGRNHYGHLLADAAGQEIMIVLTENFDMYSGVGSAMKTDPDQRDVFEGEAAA